jgi:hypothetical protein
MTARAACGGYFGVLRRGNQKGLAEKMPVSRMEYC